MQILPFFLLHQFQKILIFFYFDVLLQSFLNSIRDKGATFEHNTNKISIIEKDLTTTDFTLKNKDDVAKDIISVILKTINK